jgi:hypothetical protein
MTTLCTVTVTDAGQDTKAIEVFRVARALHLAADKIRKHGGAITSGTILDDGGVSLGTWSLTGSAPS